jgi:general secretion pathway protein F
MFRYVLVDSRGRRRKGILRLDDEAEAAAVLERDGGHILDLTEIRGHSAGHSSSGSRISSEELSLFLRLSGMMLNARLQPLEVFQTLLTQARTPGFRSFLEDLTRGLKKGRPVSEMLDSYPERFDAVTRSLIRSGETVGTLGESFQSAWELNDAVGRLRRRLISVLIYPSLVMALAFVVFIAVIVFLVPGFASLYSDLGGRLPLLTSFLFGISRLISSYPWLVIIGLLCLAGAGWFFRHRLLGFLRRLPYIREVLRALEASRLTFALSLLLRQNLPPDEAFVLLSSGEAGGPFSRRDSWLKAVDIIRSGGRVTEALESMGVLDPIGIQLIAGGEGGGRIGEMLRAVSALEMERYESRTNVLLAVLQPALILLIGVVIGGLILAIFLPVFNAVNFL